MAKWSIEITNFLGGFAPAWYKETYPSYGNKNQAGTMTNCDLTNPGYLTQGPGLANLTNGTQANTEFDANIKGATDYAVTSDVAYAVGGAKLHKFSSTALTADATWAHTISHDGSELGEDVALYQGNLYYSYNQTGAVGDVGKYDLSSTFDDDWGSTTPTGAAALASAPHPMTVGGNDTLYIGNGRYIASYDGTTFDAQGLDLPTGAEVQAIRWNADRLWIAAKKTTLTGTNKNLASIYVWDGAAGSWEMEIPLMGTVGALHVKNGVLFVFYQDLSSTGGYKLGYVSGGGIVDVANYTGGLPAFYQVTDYLDFIIWNSAGSIFAFGSGDKDLPVRLFQFADGGYATVGCVVCPFGTPIISSTDGAGNFRLAKFSGYDTTTVWKSLMFDVTGNNRLSRIDRVKVNFELMGTGALVGFKLVNNGGVTLYTDTISNAKLGAKATRVDYPLGKLAENFRVEFDYTGGSTSNPVKIKNVKIYGSTE